MYCICGFGFGRRKIQSQASYQTPGSSEDLPRYTTRAPLTENWLQHLLDSIQEHSFRRRNSRVRGIEHATPFVYGKLPSDNELNTDEEPQLSAMSENETLSIG